jgi:hypothetical protein
MIMHREIQKRLKEKKIGKTKRKGKEREMNTPIKRSKEEELRIDVSQCTWS